MNTKSEALCEAMSVLADAKNKYLKFDRTVTATVSEVRSIEKGDYLVEYQGGRFQVWGTPGVAYKKGENVQIKIPEGDMSNKKIIEGVTQDIIELYESYKKRNQILSYNLAEDLNSDKLLFKLIAGKEEYAKDSQDDRTTILTLDSAEFKNYMKLHSALSIGVTVKTQFVRTVLSGKYGAIIKLYPEGVTEDPLVYYLDSNNFNGSIYDFITPSEQSLIINFTPGNYDKLTIELYEKDFIYEGNESELIEDERLRQENIFFINFEIYMTSAITVEAPYVVQVQQIPKEDNKILLTPSLYYGGTKVDNDDIEWVWYHLSDSWKEVEANEEEALLVDLLPGVLWKTAYYKAEAVLAEDKYMSQEIVVKNNNLQTNFDVVSDSVTHTLSLNINPKDAEYAVKWVFEGNESYAKEGIDWVIPEEILHNYQERIFICYIYSGDTLVHKIRYYYEIPVNLFRPFTIPVEGTDWFYYNNYSILTTAQNQFTLRVPKMVSQKENGEEKNKSIVDLNWYWRGVDLINQDTLKAITLEDSLIDSFNSVNITDTHYEITFTVSKRFNKNKSHNNYLVISCKCNSELYTQKIPLNFIINGQSGTNGTNYYVGLERVESNEGYYLRQGKTGRFKVEVRSNSNNENVSFNLPEVKDITSEGISIERDATSKIFIITANSTAKKSYIKFNIIVNNIIIPCFQSFTIGVGDAPAIITNLPYSIMYDANGYNHNWSVLTNLTVNGLELSENNPFTFNDDIANENNKIIKQISNNYRLKPREVLDPNNFYDVITITHNNKTYYHTIISHYNRYGNETINGWDGQSIETKDGHIFAPTLGAGKKVNNLFTGVVMGRDEQQDLIGIYGYQNGIRSFSFNENGDAYLKGKIEAGSGEISGWKIGTFDDDYDSGSYTNSLYYDTANNYRVFLRGPSGNGSVCFGIKKYTSINSEGYGFKDTDTATTNGNGYVYYVDNNGKLYAKAAEIEGKIIATAGEIGGCSISNGKLQIANANIGSLSVDKITGGTNSSNINFSGTITCDKLIAKNGSQIGGWNITADCIRGDISWKDSQGNTHNAAMRMAAGSTIATDNQGWFECWYDNSYPFQVTRNGILKAMGAEISGSITATSFTAKNGDTATVYVKMEDDSLKFYPKGDTSNPKLSMGYNSQNLVQFIMGSGSTNDSTTANRFLIEKYGTYVDLKFGVTTGSAGLNILQLGAGSDTTNNPYAVYLGANSGNQKMKIASGSVIDIVTNTLNFNGDAFELSSGTWTNSDYNLKNSIQNLSNNYEIFFDNIDSKIYKYNNGNSGRYHVGFIAQEIKESLDKAQLSTQEFAGYGVDESTGNCMLRYEEFIALNTWQIQKAKARISELETRVSQLESLLQANLD